MGQKILDINVKTVHNCCQNKQNLIASRTTQQYSRKKTLKSFKENYIFLGYVKNDGTINSHCCKVTWRQSAAPMQDVWLSLLSRFPDPDKPGSSIEYSFI
jgi:hypothetical protein